MGDKTIDNPVRSSDSNIQNNMKHVGDKEEIDTSNTSSLTKSKRKIKNKRQSSVYNESSPPVIDGKMENQLNSADDNTKLVSSPGKSAVQQATLDFGSFKASESQVEANTSNIDIKRADNGMSEKGIQPAVNTETENLAPTDIPGPFRATCAHRVQQKPNSGIEDYIDWLKQQDANKYEQLKLFCREDSNKDKYITELEANNQALEEKMQKLIKFDEECQTIVQTLLEELKSKKSSIWAILCGKIRKYDGIESISKIKYICDFVRILEAEVGQQASIIQEREKKIDFILKELDSVRITKDSLEETLNKKIFVLRDVLNKKNDALAIAKKGSELKEMSYQKINAELTKRIVSLENESKIFKKEAENKQEQLKLIKETIEHINRKLKDQKTITRNLNEENNQLEAKVSNLKRVLEEALEKSAELELKKLINSEEDLETSKELDGQSEKQDFQVQPNDASSAIQNGRKRSQSRGKKKKR